MFLMSFKSICILKCLRNFCSSALPIKMAYNVYNDGKKSRASKPSLIIMHGLFGSKQNWKSICRALESKTDRQIIALDARNHGDSPHTTEINNELMAIDIIELMKDMNIKKSVVLGHSIGGRSMMYLALKYPEYVDGAIIVDISPLSIPKDFHEMQDIFLIMKEIVLNLPPKLSMSEGRKLAGRELKKFITRNETIDFILLNLKKRQEDDSFTWIVNVEALHNNLSQVFNFMNEIAGLKPYAGQVMFICGKRSNFVDPKTWPDIQKLFPNSKIHWLDSGHLVHLEQPKIFNDLVIKFLNK